VQEPRLERLTITVFTLATLTGIVILATSESHLVNYVALAITVAGALAARCWRWAGISLFAIGPLLSTLATTPATSSGVGSETILVWSLVVFAAFFWSLNGTRAIPLGLTAGIGSGLAFAITSPLHWIDPLVGAALATTFAAAAAGSAVSSQRGYLAEAEGRRQDAKLTREAEIDRRIAEERVRIARDLHDVVGHQAAVVSMHLGAAELHLATDPEATAKDLKAARSGVQAVLRETQRILEILRVGPGEDGALPVADQPHLLALVDSFRRAGSPIEADLDPLPAETTPDVSAALYRTMQEALTNAQKHGTGPTVIRLTVQPSTVQLQVTNPVKAPGKVPTKGGYGLIGMQERVSAAGGTMKTSTNDATFLLEVSMRLDGRPLR
jgi:signal transduction histidine kinase